MKLRSGTTLVSEQSENSIVYTITEKSKKPKKTEEDTNDEDNTTPRVCNFITNTKKEFDDYPCINDIKNIRYIVKIYELFDTEFFNIYKEMKEDSMVNIAITIYKKTLLLMSETITMTYNPVSLDYTSSEKEIIVIALFKMRNVFIRIRELLTEIEHKSKYMKKLLCYSKTHIGSLITNKNSYEAIAYYSYRHLYNSEEENDYYINTYEDGNYSYEEIYDYYYAPNIKKDKKEDLFIKKDYIWWFENKRNTNIYSINSYNTIDRKSIYTIDEIKHRSSFHLEEMAELDKTIDKLNDIISEKKEIIELHRLELLKYDDILINAFRE